MSATIAIIKKEMRSYFCSPIAYVVIGVFLFIMGIIFTKFVNLYARYAAAQQFGAAQSITLDKLAFYLYQNVAFILCFVAPFLTMRLFAEEKKQQTLELLLTAPIKMTSLVMGKFLAAFSLMGIMVLLSFIYVFP